MTDPFDHAKEISTIAKKRAPLKPTIGQRPTGFFLIHSLTFVLIGCRLSPSFVNSLIGLRGIDLVRIPGELSVQALCLLGFFFGSDKEGPSG